MKGKYDILSIIGLSRLAVVLVFAAWSPGLARAAEHAEGHSQGMPGMMQTEHIMIQAQAEALKPGDSMSMTCTKCKSVIPDVTTDKAHVKMMTVGEKVKCTCGGTVEVVATDNGEGNNAEVKQVCSKCGDDAMFCSAVEPSSGAMKVMPMEKK